MLYPHLRISQIFGANTNVGKTIFATILSLATATSGRRVFYLKPVSTGSWQDADTLHIKKYKGKRASIKTRCLIQLEDPVSPHLAAKSSHMTISDRFLLQQVHKYAKHCSQKSDQTRTLDALYIETAGGVLSPVPSGTTQADAYRPLRLPVILIGDSNLGGISSTLSAFESLYSRGYTVTSVLLFNHPTYQNHTYLSSYFNEHHPHVKVLAFEPPPKKGVRWTPESDEIHMKGYYNRVASTSEVMRLVRHLDTEHTERIIKLSGMSRKACDAFWYPFVQHKSFRALDVTVIDSAHGDLFTTFSLPPNPLTPLKSLSAPVQQERRSTPLLNPKFDGSASWWTQGLGHANPKLTTAAAHAAGRYGHVIFPLVVHEPALELAETLLNSQGKGWASKVFFSDNGSTGMEVAIKMALRATATLYGEGIKPELEVLGLKGSYHGDTLGAMDACEGGAYNKTVEWYRGRGYWLESPTLGFENGELRVRIPWNGSSAPLASLGVAYDVKRRRDSNLELIYKSYITQQITRASERGHKFGALVLEPLVLGAGGMQFVDPLFQTVLVETVRSISGTLLPTQYQQSRISTLPVIFDEVFSGLGRLGFSNPAATLGVYPDIAVYAKLLTGGLLPMAVTLATKDIFQVFYGDEKAQALLHGHSYTAYPAGCAVATTSLKLIDESLKSESWKRSRHAWTNEDNMETYIPVSSMEEDPTKPDVPCSLWSYSFVQALSRKKHVKKVMTLGTVVAFELEDDSSGYNSLTAEAILAPLRTNSRHRRPGSEGDHSVRLSGEDEEGLGDTSVHFRTLGNIGYLISSLSSEKRLIRRMEERLLQLFHN